MPFLGTIVNFFGVLISGLLGLLVKRGIPKRISDAIVAAMGVCVLYIGIDGALDAVPQLETGSFFTQGLVQVIIMILSMAIGTLIGELLNIHGGIERLGDFVEKKFASKATDGDKKSNFSKAFVTSTILYCVGAMAVTGSLEDGMGSPDTILAKTVIDCIVNFVLATSLGVGCVFSAFSVLIYQGAIAAVGYFLQSFLPEASIAYMSAVGSLVMIFVATNVLEITKVKTVNMVPAVFIPIALVPLFEWML